MHCCLWGHLVFAFKKQSVFSREDLPFYFPTSSIVWCFFVLFSIPLVTLGVCAFYLYLFFKLEPLRYILPSHCCWLCCISQITDVEDRFMCLFVIYISSSVKNLLMYFAHFVIRNFFLIKFCYSHSLYTSLCQKCSLKFFSYL